MTLKFKKYQSFANLYIKSGWNGRTVSFESLFLMGAKMELVECLLIETSIYCMNLK